MLLELIGPSFQFSEQTRWNVVVTANDGGQEQVDDLRLFFDGQRREFFFEGYVHGLNLSVRVALVDAFGFGVTRMGMS